MAFVWFLRNPASHEVIQSLSTTLLSMKVVLFKLLSLLFGQGDQGETGDTGRDGRPGSKVPWFLFSFVRLNSKLGKI